MVGIGASVHMHQEEGHHLVGGTRRSVGFNLVTKSLWFDGFKVAKYPKGKSRDFCIPTLFYMYVDLENNQLSFGSEDEYWGVALSIGEIRRDAEDFPIFPMTSFRKVQGRLMLFYKGQGRWLMGIYTFYSCIKHNLSFQFNVWLWNDMTLSIQSSVTQQLKTLTSWMYN